jgi:hypothetical protein
VPFTGDPAEKYALQLMARERAQETVSRAFGQILAAEAKKVQYNKDYTPAKPAPPAPSNDAPKAAAGS